MKKILKLTCAIALLLFSASCQKEDLTKEYRRTFTGKYDIVSIYEASKTPLDLNGDGVTSQNLRGEYASMTPMDFNSQSAFSFLANADGSYDGQLAFNVPLQNINTEANPPYTAETPVTFPFKLGLLYGILFDMKLSAEGEASWAPALQERNSTQHIYSALLYDAEVLKAENGELDIIVREVPVYDCKTEKLALMTLTYHLEHE